MGRKPRLGTKAASVIVPSPASADVRVAYRTAEVDGIHIFYRESGPRDAPAILLMHGFPTSSHMFRDLIPGLADRYHVIAPDYPGFGYSDFPDAKRFHYSFDSYARMMERLC